VNLVPTFPAVLAGLILFFAPGLAFASLLSERDRESLEPDEALFLIVAVSVMASAWLALVLAEAGRFSLVRAASVLALASLTAAASGRGRLSWPMRRPPTWSRLVPALVVLALALALQARPSEYLLGGRDPGTYVAAMSLIGRTGGIAYTDPLVLAIPPEAVELFFRHPDGPDYSWGRFMGFPLERPQTGKVVPLFFHLFPAFGAYLFQALGVKGALATAPLFGVLATMSVFFALRRLFGPAPALLGTVLLALNVVQVWFARYPVSEMVSQFLLFVAVLAFAHWEERGSRAFGALAGAALGLSLLVRIDSALILVPLLFCVLLRRARHDLAWRALKPLAIPLVLLSGHVAIHAAFWSRKYVLDIARRPYWSEPAWVWIAGALLVAASVVAAHRWSRPLLLRLEQNRATLQVAVAATLLLLTAYAYFVRPWLSAWAGADGNPRELAAATGGLPGTVLRSLGFRRLAAHDAQSLVRFGWAVTPLGLILGVLGLATILREWRARYLFPVTTALVFSVFYFYKLRIWNDYFFAWRRFVPVVLPFLLGFAAFLLCRMAARGGTRRWLAGAMAAALAAAYVKDTARMATHVDWRNSVRFVADVARRFGPDDVVIFEQPGSLHLLSLPLWSVHGVNVLELARYDPDRECPDCLSRLIRAWRSRFHNIYIVHTYRTNLCGLFVERVPSADYRFGTTEWERAFDHLPRAAEPHGLNFTLSRVVLPEELSVPPLAEVDIGGSDDFQVSGFFDKEGGASRTYRWTGPCASVYLPGAKPGGSLVITASSDKRPASQPALVRVSLSGLPLGSFLTRATWEDHTLALPTLLGSGPPVLRLEILDPVTLRPSPWRPINVLPGSSDTRDLGIVVDRIRLRPFPRSGAEVPGSAAPAAGATLAGSVMP
jgi:Dolichyl-phosphate-mannose-protein mannosyltransferase